MASKKQHRRSHKSGMPPGALVYVGDRAAGPSEISSIRYTPDECVMSPHDTLEEACQFVDAASNVWINIIGLHDPETIDRLGKQFNIHSLVLEDILNTEQRPKIEIYEDYIFISLKMLTPSQNGELIFLEEQVSMIMTHHAIVTIQEQPGDVFGAIRERIQRPDSTLRQRGVDYLMYRLIDTIVDHYLTILEQFSLHLDDLEDRIFANVKKLPHNTLLQTKRKIQGLKRITIPLRELIGALLRSDTLLIHKDTHRYLGDIYDHLIQILEQQESLRDFCVELYEAHLTMLSHSANEVMKLLTVIATIFIPLTFIVGVYGMNFHNMPELEWKYGYFIIWGIMVAIIILMLFYFRKKGWLVKS